MIQSAFSFVQYTCLRGKFVFLSFVAFYYCFLSSITIQLFSLACQPLLLPPPFNALKRFVPFFIIVIPDPRTALVPILLYPDWCVRKKMYCM